MILYNKGLRIDVICGSPLFLFSFVFFISSYSSALLSA